MSCHQRTSSASINLFDFFHSFHSRDANNKDMYMNAFISIAEKGQKSLHKRET